MKEEIESPSDIKKSSFDDLLTTIEAASIKLGEACGLEELGKWYRKVSGTAFSQGDDAGAKSFRGTAIEVEVRAGVERKAYNEKHKPARRLAIDEIARRLTERDELLADKK